MLVEQPFQLTIYIYWLLGVQGQPNNLQQIKNNLCLLTRLYLSKYNTPSYEEGVSQCKNLSEQLIFNRVGHLCGPGLSEFAFSLES